MTVILLDIDGPLNPFLDFSMKKFTVGGGDWNQGRFNTEILRPRFTTLREISNVEFVWASAWQEEAHTLETILGLPLNLPYITFNRPPLADTWKLPSIQEWVEKHGHDDTPLVWLDDEIKDDAHEWATKRGNTLLVTSTPESGWTESEYQQVLDFCHDHA